MIREFIKHAGYQVPAKFQKPFMRDLASWFMELSVEEKARLTKALEDGRSQKIKWQILIDNMFELFKKKQEVNHG